MTEEPGAPTRIQVFSRPASKSPSIGGVDVRRLRYFIAVAEEKHFGRGSERLHVAQPALSRQIALLERAIGAQLFDRSRSQIRLTVAGETLLPRARDILQRVSEATRLTRHAADGMSGSIEIGFVGSATYSVLPRILNQFRAEHPDVELGLHVMNTAELRIALVERRIDVAFARPGIHDAEITNEPVLDEALIVAMPEDNPLVAQGAIALADLAAYPFVLYPRQPRPSFSDTIISLCERAGFRPTVAQETMDLQTALGLIAVGAGISLVPASVEESQRHGVAYRPLSGRALRTVLSLAYRQDNRSPVLQKFCAAVRHATTRRCSDEIAREDLSPL